MTRIRVISLEPISGPYGHYNVGEDGKKEWVYCIKIDGKWYFKLEQSFKED